MVPVALVLFSRGSDVGYGVAGLFAAAYTAGAAVGGPLLARWMDRTGQTRVIVGAGVASSVALALLPFVGVIGGIVVAAIAGAATPPVEPGLRAIWRSAFTSRRRLRSGSSARSRGGRRAVADPTRPRRPRRCERRGVR